MYAGDRSTARSIVDAVTAKVSRALRDAKFDTIDTTTEPPAVPGWYADPWREHGLRWWERRSWTGRTARLR